jgi:hypothetical protein
LINIAVELEGYDEEKARRWAADIEQRMARIVSDAEVTGTTPLSTAVELARRRLETRPDALYPSGMDPQLRSSRTPTQPN